MRSFWLSYFTATHAVAGCWLACLSPQQRVQLLENLMQWEVTTRDVSASFVADINSN